MKTFLRKINGIYTLMKDGKMIASDDIDFQKDYELQKLSIENCNQIFGIFDVEKLAEDFAKNHSIYPSAKDDTEYGFKHGFNKALELNKAKEFTLEQVIEAMSLYKRNEFAMSKVLSIVLEQPLEIEVEIEMESMNIDEIREQGKGFLNGNTMKPKLDENGCLILKITD
jgi:hypothetical protein